MRKRKKLKSLSGSLSTNKINNYNRLGENKEIKNNAKEYTEQVKE